MEEGRFKHLIITVLGSENFKELAKEYIKQYSRRSPENEMETIRLYERIRFIQELIDTGKSCINEENQNRR